MARTRGGTIYVSTDPNATLAIGIPGVSITLGRLGPTIYAPTIGGGTGNNFEVFGGNLDFTPATVPVQLEF